MRLLLLLGLLFAPPAWAWTAPLASGIGLVEETFYPCVKSSAVNTAIAVISAAPGSGGIVSVSAWGYQM